MARSNVNGSVGTILKRRTVGQSRFSYYRPSSRHRDVQLTLAQKANINGSVIISTPQDVALIDARKSNSNV